jgi:hypothetical protein
LRKRCTQVQETFSTPNIHNPNRNSAWHIIVKALGTEKEERILKATRENHQITYVGKFIRVTDFSKETLKVRKANEVFQILNENYFKSRLLYSDKLSFKIARETKAYNKQKLIKWMSTKSAVQ